MAYFNQAFLDFFDGLSKNNNREWFEDNKKTYLKEAKEPFEAFVGDVIERLREVYPGLDITPKKSIFRIYRDVRFSKDKTPYKVHCSAVVGKNGKSGGLPGFFFQFSSLYMHVGGGVYQPDKEGLYNIRSEIAYSQEEFAKLMADKKFIKAYGELKGEKNKIIPKDFRDDHAKQPLIANKQYYYMADLEPKGVLADDLLDTIFNYLMAGKPLNDFLERALFTE